MPMLLRVPGFITDKASQGPGALLNFGPEEAFEFVQIVQDGLLVDSEFKNANTAFLLCVIEMPP